MSMNKYIISLFIVLLTVPMVSALFDGHNRTLSNTAVSNGCQGVWFNVSKEVTIFNVTRYATNAPKYWYLFEGAKVSGVSNCNTGSGGTAILNGTFDTGVLWATVNGSTGIKLYPDRTYSYMLQETSATMYYGGASDTPVIGTSGVFSYFRGQGDGTPDAYIRSTHGFNYTESAPPIKYIRISSLTPLNYTYNSSDVPTFVGNVTAINQTWNLSLVINGTTKHTISVNSVGTFNMTTAPLTKGQEYSWWFSGLDIANVTNTNTSERRNIFILGNSSTTVTSSCVVNLGNAYFRPNSCGVFP